MERIKLAIEKAKDSADQRRAEGVGRHGGEAPTLFKAAAVQGAPGQGGSHGGPALTKPQRAGWPMVLSLGLLLVGGAWFLFGADNRTVPAPVQDPLGASSTGVNSAAAVPPAPGQAAAPVPADPPAPVATNQPAVVAETAPSAASREAEVAAAVEAWRSAWAARDMGKYLDAYSRAFVPEGGVSRQDWVANRYRNVGGRPSIDVVIRNVQIESLAQNSVRVSFLQDYAAGAVRELDRLKTLELVLEDQGRWRIVRESQGASAPGR